MKCRFCEWTTAQHTVLQWEGSSDLAHVDALRQHIYWTHRGQSKAIYKATNVTLQKLRQMAQDRERDEWDSDAPVIPCYTTAVQTVNARKRRERKKQVA